MSSDIAIRACGLGKCYHMYDTPRDRLFQMLFRGRRQYYKEFWALQDISLEVRRGETVGIVGRNGTGKSTLLQLICGTLSPSMGTVQVAGRVAALLELGAGFNPEFTGRENVFMNAAILGLTPAEIDEKFDDIAAFADIGAFIEQPVKTYSSGMYVRLAFAVIANVNADVLIIDEALAVGDVFFTQKCMRFLRKFRETGTILFVSHDTGAVINLCDHAICLEAGKVHGRGSAKEVCETYLATFYDTKSDDKVKDAADEDKSSLAPCFPVEMKDQRLDFINTTNLRNDIEVFVFNGTAESFGLRGAVIESVELMDDQGARLLWVVGGEVVKLVVQVRCVNEIFRPIVGFFVKDRLGQVLFGDNTWLSYLEEPLHLAADDWFATSFTFRMPILPLGDYSVMAAIAEGTQYDHVQHHWIHDALIFRSHSTSITTGLVGVPMFAIVSEKQEKEA